MKRMAIFALLAVLFNNIGYGLAAERIRIGYSSISGSYIGIWWRMAPVSLQKRVSKIR